MQNDPVLLIINGLLNVPMICLFKKNNFSLCSSTSETEEPETEEPETRNKEQETKNKEQEDGGSPAARLWFARLTLARLGLNDGA